MVKTDDLIGKHVEVILRVVLPRHTEIDKVIYRMPIGILRKDWRGNLFLELDDGTFDKLTDEIICFIPLEHDI